MEDDYTIMNPVCMSDMSLPGLFLQFHLYKFLFSSSASFLVSDVNVNILLCLGLNDTVFDVDHDKDRALYNGLEPNGFSFDGTDAPGVDYALNR